jgi:hypothetical protein
MVRLKWLPTPGEEQVAVLPEIVAYYMEFVYSNKLPTDIYTTASPGFGKLAGYTVLAKLYVLAERLLDAKCRNRVLQELVRLRGLALAGQLYSPNIAIVNIVYEGTAPGSAARRFLLDLHASHGRDIWYPHAAERNPTFMEDLVHVLLRNVEKFNSVDQFRHIEVKAEDYFV